MGKDLIHLFFSEYGMVVLLLQSYGRGNAIQIPPTLFQLNQSHRSCLVIRCETSLESIPFSCNSSLCFRASLMTFIIKSSKKPLSIGLHIPLSSLKEVNQALCALVSDFQIRIQRRKRKVITMVMTLRSLCLLKVNELREDRGFKIPED